MDVGVQNPLPQLIESAATDIKAVAALIASQHSLDVVEIAFLEEFIHPVSRGRSLNVRIGYAANSDTAVTAAKAARVHDAVRAALGSTWGLQMREQPVTRLKEG